MKRIIGMGMVVMIWLVGGLLPVLAEETITVINQDWQADFRDHLTFMIQAESEAEIVELDLYYRIVGRPATSRNEVEFTPGHSIEAEFVIDQTKPENYLPPGTELEYWWKIVDSADNELKTEKQTLLYLDNRYDWQKLVNERVGLYWYEGDQSFGQALFDRANEALDTLETDMGIMVEDRIKIFIYANHQDLLGAISTSAQEWTGGQAFTRYGVVVIGVRPSQLEWGLGATTHEMTHLVVHQATENPYGDLPTWLDEGIAVYNENQEELDQDFRPAFERAVKNDQLMTLRSLSSPFPSDPDEAQLAYGQSGAVVKFMIDTYGTEAMANLLDIFSRGALYDEALNEALGVDMDGLDNAFRASYDLPPLPGTAPVETEEEVITPAEEAEETETEPEDMPEVGIESEGVSPGGQPEEKEEDRRGLPIGLPCLAGLLPLIIGGGAVILRSE